MIIKNDIQNKKDLIIFDIDGTLVFYDSLQKLVKEALKIHGYESKNEYINMQINGVVNILNDATNKVIFNYDNMVKYWNESMPFLKTDSKAISETMYKLEEKYLKIYPNVKETLDKINIKMVCSTNWFLKNQLIKLDKFNLTKYFSKIYTCEEIYAKPNFKHFEYILENECIDIKNAVVVGDSKSDIICSQYGLDSILVDYNNCKQNIYDLTTGVVNNFEDVKKLIKL